MVASEYLIGDNYRLDAARPELWRGQERTKLGPTPLTILVYLIQHRDRYVSGKEILENALRSYIHSSTLRFHISSIYKGLGDNGRVKEFISNNRHGGYKFIGAIKEISRSPEINSPQNANSLLLMPQPLNEDFRFDDFQRYVRESPRLVTLDDIGDIPSRALGGPPRMPVGTKWVVENVDHIGVRKYTWILAGTTSFEKMLVYVLRNVEGAVVLVDMLTNNHIGNITRGKVTWINWPNEGVFSWPLYIGKTWEGCFSLTYYEQEMCFAARKTQYTVTGKEDVSVPAGTFNTFRIEGRPALSESMTRTVWYAPVPGIMVKRIWDYTGNRQTMELSHYPMTTE